MLHVAVIGSYPDQILTHLKAADYTVTVYESFSKYPQDSQDAPVAVVAYGADTGLDSTNAVKFLKSNAILLLFSPSNDLLQSIKSEISTAIDLPRIKLTDGIPLIIYRLHATDRFHFIPGFSLGISEDGTPKANYSESLEYSVKLIAECTSHAREVVKPSDSFTTIILEPPPGTRYYVNASISIVTNNGPSSSNVNWRVNVYCYTANYIPAKDFKGKVYIVMTHGGVWKTGTIDAAKSQEVGVANAGTPTYRLTTKAPGGFAVEAQSPQGGTKQDETYYFNASWRQDLHLFEGTNSQPRTFSAEYSTDYSIPFINQTTLATGGFEFSVDNNSSDRTTLLNGVSVFSGGLEKVEFKCSADSNTGDSWRSFVNASLPLDLTFGV